MGCSFFSDLSSDFSAEDSVFSSASALNMKKVSKRVISKMCFFMAYIFLLNIVIIKLVFKLSVIQIFFLNPINAKIRRKPSLTFLIQKGLIVSSLLRGGHPAAVPTGGR
jgi:hypothetical protein